MEGLRLGQRPRFGRLSRERGETTKPLKPARRCRSEGQRKCWSSTFSTRRGSRDHRDSERCKSFRCRLPSGPQAHRHCAVDRARCEGRARRHPVGDAMSRARSGRRKMWPRSRACERLYDARRARPAPKPIPIDDPVEMMTHGRFRHVPVVHEHGDRLARASISIGDISQDPHRGNRAARGGDCAETTSAPPDRIADQSCKPLISPRRVTAPWNSTVPPARLPRPPSEMSIVLHCS